MRPLRQSMCTPVSPDTIPEEYCVAHASVPDPYLVASVCGSGLDFVTSAGFVTSAPPTQKPQPRRAFARPIPKKDTRKDAPPDKNDTARLTAEELNKPLTAEQQGQYAGKVFGGFISRLAFEQYQAEDASKLQPLQLDVEGAYSLSEGLDVKVMCRYLHDCLTHITHDEKGVRVRQLTITDAGAGCGGESMNFLAAVEAPRAGVPGTDFMFDRVNSIEISLERVDMLRNNMQQVAVLCKRKGSVPEADPSAPYACINADYKKYLGPKNPLFLYQDIVFLDPPWGGKSSTENRANGLYLYDEAKKKDLDMSIPEIIKRLIKQNEHNRESETVIGETKVVVVKAPSKWDNSMLFAAAHIPGVYDYVCEPVYKYDYWFFFLNHKGQPEHAYVPDISVTMPEFQTCRQHQQQLEEFFPSLKGKINAEHPMFLQNFWEEAEPKLSEPVELVDGFPRAEGEEAEPKLSEPVELVNGFPRDEGETDHHYYWRSHFVKQYVPGALHNERDLHNGEKKLLQSSLYTILYGLKRVKKKHPELSWPEILKSTIVLYVGAAGCHAGSHHFNELLQAIPDVHFVCYDIRTLEVELPPALEGRITRFHKIFTETDLNRWISFGNKYTHKALIFISDIRSDWTGAKNEMDATRDVVVDKIRQLKLRAVHKHPTDTTLQDSFIENSYERDVIDQLMTDNRHIAQQVDRQITIDNYVQWQWIRRLQQNTKTCAIYSSKTKEPYQTAKNLKEKYIHFPGAELLSTAAGMASSETRTNITATDFTLTFPSGLQALEGFWKFTCLQCIEEHFNKKYGDQNSFATEEIDYNQEYHNSNLKDGAIFGGFPRRSILIHDMKFAWYNSDAKQERQRLAVDKFIRQMYVDWKKGYVEAYEADGYNSNAFTRKRYTVINFDLEAWFKETDEKTKQRPIPTPSRKHESKINVDKLRRSTKGHATASIAAVRADGWTLKKLNRYLRIPNVLYRYETHLIENNKGIWDVSVQALGTLLMLNLNLQSTARPTHKWQFGNSQNAIVNFKQTDELPENHLFAQLVFNLTNPYSYMKDYRNNESNPSEKFFGDTNLSQRYDKITQFLSSIQYKYYDPVKGVDSVDNYWHLNPGSETGVYLNKEPPQTWLEIRTGSGPDSSYDDKHRLKMAVDWYCYWLQRTLHSTERQNFDEHHIAYALTPYMKFDRHGFCLDLGNETQLQLERWPLGKPVLYFACQQACIPMIKFCMMGLEEDEITRKINTPRSKIMKKLTWSKSGQKYYTAEFVVENYPLHAAAWKGEFETVEYLLTKCHAEPKLLNYWQETAGKCAQVGREEWRARQKPDFDDGFRKMTEYSNCLKILKKYEGAEPRPDFPDTRGEI